MKPSKTWTATQDVENRCFATGKRGYPTGARARKAMKQLRETTKADGTKRTPRSVYQCESCGAWHLTSQTRAEQERVRMILATRGTR